MFTHGDGLSLSFVSTVYKQPLKACVEKNAHKREKIGSLDSQTLKHGHTHAHTHVYTHTESLELIPMSVLKGSVGSFGSRLVF